MTQNQLSTPRRSAARLIVAAALTAALVVGIGWAAYGVGADAAPSKSERAIVRQQAAAATRASSLVASQRAAARRGAAGGHRDGQSRGKRLGARHGRAAAARKLRERTVAQAAAQPPATPVQASTPLYLQPGYKDDPSKPLTDCEGSNPAPDCAEFPVGSDP